MCIITIHAFTHGVILILAAVMIAPLNEAGQSWKSNDTDICNHNNKTGADFFEYFNKKVSVDSRQPTWTVVSLLAYSRL